MRLFSRTEEYFFSIIVFDVVYYLLLRLLKCDVVYSKF